MIELLLNAGCDTNITDLYGFKASDIHEEVMQLNQSRRNIRYTFTKRIFTSNRLSLEKTLLYIYGQKDVLN